MSGNTQQTILVTGGAGFIGSHLARELAKSQDYTVYSLDNYFTGSSKNKHKDVEYLEGHTKNIEKIVSFSPDIVYHLGEYSRVEQSFEDIDTVLDLNIAGTHGVLEFCRKKGAKLVYAGSSTKFGDGGLGRAQSPYAWTKASNTELISNYARWFQIPFAITYFYNVYGPGERSGKYGTVIEIFKEKRRKNEPLTVVTPGTQKRNFTHIDDIVRGLIIVGEKGEGDNYGLGNEKSYSILELAKMFDAPIEMLPARKGNRMEASLDLSKSRALGWEAQKNVEDYIDEFIKTFS